MWTLPYRSLVRAPAEQLAQWDLFQLRLSLNSLSVRLPTKCEKASKQKFTYGQIFRVCLGSNSWHSCLKRQMRLVNREMCLKHLH